MFTPSKYTNWYNTIIERALKQYRTNDSHKYVVHHIIPRSLGGDEHKNTVLLTHREHYVCHLLLIKMTTDRSRSKMVYAFFRFNPKDSNVTSSRTYERFVISFSRATMGEFNAFYGKKHTPETLQKISGKNHPMFGTSVYKLWVERYGIEEADRRQTLKNKRISDGLRGKRNGMFGKQHTIEWRTNHSQMMSGSGNPNYGKDWCWIHRGGTTKRIERHQLDEFTVLGWSRGRK